MNLSGSTGLYSSSAFLGVVAAVWYAIWKDKKAQQGEGSSAYLFGNGEPWYVIGMAIFAAKHRL